MFTSKKKIVIEAFKKQKEKLNERASYEEDGAWSIYTKQIIKTSFGEKSEFYDVFVDRIEPRYHFRHDITQEQFEKFTKETKVKLEKFIDGCIEIVNINGVYQEEKPNFISKMSNELLWTLIGSVASVVFIAGYSMSDISHKIDEQKFEQSIENKRDSIVMLIKQLITRPVSSDSITNKNTPK